jgi:tetratricopeptide (TPR) repeat protein
VGVFLVLHVWSANMEGPSLWGLHFLAFFPTWVTAVFLVVGVMFLILAFSGTAASRSGQRITALDFWAPGRGSLARSWLLVLVASALFILFRSATHLLGDGYVYLRELPLVEASGRVRAGHEPGSLRLVAAIHHYLISHIDSPVAAYRIYSVAAGGLYVLLTVKTARAVAGTLAGRFLTLVLLLIPGYLQLFCGYVETYALIMSATLLYLWLGLQALAASRSFWLPAAILGLSLPLHFSMVALLPSLLVLLWLRGRPPNRAGRLPDWLGLSLLPLVAVATLWLLGFDLRAYLAELRNSHLLPLRSDPDFYQPYQLLSWSHLGDLLNLLVLVAPAVVMAFPVLLRRDTWRGDRSLFLLSAVVPGLFMVGLVNPEIGAFRDWDLLALPAVPLTLWTAVAMVNHLDRDPNWERLALIVCGAAALHSALWIGVNARPEAAVARFTRCMETAPLSQHARAYGWESLGSYHEHDRGDARQAANAYDRAIAVDEDNPRYWNLAGAQYAALGERRQAIRYLERAVALQTNADPSHLNNLAACYTEIGEYERAAHYFARAVDLQPRFAMGHHNLGLVLMKVGRLPEAVEALARANALQPDNPVILRDLGTALAQVGRAEEAEQVFRRLQEVMGGMGRPVAERGDSP